MKTEPILTALHSHTYRHSLGSSPRQPTNQSRNFPPPKYSAS